MAQLSTLFISDTQSSCDYFNCKRPYKHNMSCGILLLNSPTNVHIQTIQLIIKPHENDKEMYH